MTTAVQQLMRRNSLPFCTDLSDCKTIEEGIEKAGLNFQVSLRPLYTDNGLNIGKCATVREDKQTVLGIVSPKYNILQNIEAFKFFDEYLENGLATLETAGTLKGGVKTFILAKITGEDMYVTPEDRIEKYILLSNSHDGSSVVRIGFTPIRVTCCNMLSRVHQDTQSQFMRIYHKSNVGNVLTEIKATMDEKVFDQPIRDRGISLVGFVVESVTLDEESNKKIDKYELSSNSFMQQGSLVGDYGQALKDAANNPNGAATGMIGVGMMNMASGGMVAGTAQGAFQNPGYSVAGAAQQAAPAEGTAEGTNFCPECGKPTNGSKFCPNCGKQLI